MEESGEIFSNGQKDENCCLVPRFRIANRTGSVDEAPDLSGWSPRRQPLLVAWGQDFRGILSMDQPASGIPSYLPLSTRQPDGMISRRFHDMQIQKMMRVSTQIHGVKVAHFRARG